jgi:hypothetical protein
VDNALSTRPSTAATKMAKLMRILLVVVVQIFKVNSRVKMMTVGKKGEMYIR